MITSMDHLTLVGPKSAAKELLAAVQNLGVLHVDPLEREELGQFQLDDVDSKLKDRWDSLASRSTSLLDVLAIDKLAVAGAKLGSSDVDSLEAELAGIAEQVETQVATRAEINDELDVIKTYLRPFRDLAPNLGRFDNSRYLQGSAFSVPSDEAYAELEAAIAEELPDRVILASKPSDAGYLVTAAITKGDHEAFSRILGRVGLAELSLPKPYAEHGTAKAVHMMEERSQSLPKKLEEAESELASLANQHGATLKAVSDEATNQQSRYGTMSDLAASKYSFALQGWLPTKEADAAVASLNKQFPDVVVETRRADEHHDQNVPVTYSNPKWMQPFEGLLSLFAPPKYGSFDPTWTLAIFFPFFFGLVVGDIGFGLMFLFIGLAMRARGLAGKAMSLGPLGVTIQPKALASVTAVMFWCAGWSILFGFLYGEFFGNFLEKWPENKPIFYALHHGEEHAAGPVVDGHVVEVDMHGATDSHATDADTHATDTHAAETDSHGAAVDSHGAAVDSHGAAVDSHGDEHGAEHGPNGFIPILLHRVTDTTPILLLSILFGVLQVLGGWLIRTYYGFRHGDKKHTWEGIGMFCGLLALVVAVWANQTGNTGPVTNIIAIVGGVIFMFSVIMAGMPIMIVELVSNGGAILSYLRLFAVGLSAALVANLATDLGFAISGSLPIIGPIIGILVALVVHLLAITLTIIGHTLQPLRLHYVEFFTKFGFYDANGPKYNPFRLLGGK